MLFFAISDLLVAVSLYIPTDIETKLLTLSLS